MKLPNPRGLGARRATQKGNPLNHEPARQPPSLLLPPPLRRGAAASPSTARLLPLCFLPPMLFAFRLRFPTTPLPPSLLQAAIDCDAVGGTDAHPCARPHLP